MTHVAALLLCVAGFAALAFGTSRQQDELFGRALSRAATTTWRTAGAVFLVIGLVLLVASFGSGLGLVMFSGHTSLAAGIVYLAMLVRHKVAKHRH